MQAYQKGKKLNSPNLIINFTKTREDYADRLPFVGFSVNKKFSKKAVIRNQIKRRLREIYRLYRLDPQKAERLKSIGLLVIAIKGAYEEGASDRCLYSNLKPELEKLLEQMC